MKRKSCSPCDSLESFFDDNELEVSEILIQIPLIIFQAENRNRLLVPWGVRKRRSAIDPDLYQPSVPSSSSPHLPGTCVGPTCDDDDPQAKVEPSSPATPLSFSPSETDGKSKRSKKCVSSKKKKENLLKMVEDLTHQKESLMTEIENVERFYKQLKALNSELKAKKQQLNLDTAIAEARVESREQDYHQQPLPLLLHDSAPASALVANPMGPRVIPDLNVSPEETLGPELVASLDLNLSIALNADTTQLNRAAAAQARKKRLQIYKVKKPKGGSSPSILSFG
ncbi:uncharacterized protein LOC117906138 [Vitis riparia]|uniref:uncharacterized protein LOC117906138 n=1 Tax=Vitis riparia TaxID=96939 RepID=UPI00155B35AE|nr:uncharacterized protein LOC117906138 [Vitis riparia]